MIKRLLGFIFGRKARRREAILGEPFADAWVPIVRRAVPFYDRLSETRRRRLLDNVKVFVAEKQFVGCGGMELTDEIKVTIAGGACVLLLGVPHLDVFPRLREVIVHPSDLKETVEAIGPDGRRYQIHRVRSGEAWRRGPVVLAWDSVRHSVFTPRDGYNVVYHEFAHVIDMQNGEADGIPPLESRAAYDKWTRVFFEEFDRFVAESRRGRSTFIDPYGAGHPSEFFAVVTEHFFEQPHRLQRKHAALYRLLADFYRQDPARWG